MAVPTPERREGETDKAHRALCDYARMGAGRSVRKLHQTYIEAGSESAPTVHLSTLLNWSTKYDWQERVRGYEDALKEAADAEAEREMLTGLALPRERVRLLKRIALTLSEDHYDTVAADNRLLAQLRGLLDDLAKETGGRVARSHVTTEEYDPADFSLEENRRIAAGESPADVRARRSA